MRGTSAGRTISDGDGKGNGGLFGIVRIGVMAKPRQVRTEGASEADFRLRTAIFPVKRCAKAERVSDGQG